MGWIGRSLVGRTGDEEEEEGKEDTWKKRTSCGG